MSCATRDPAMSAPLPAQRYVHRGIKIDEQLGGMSPWSWYIATTASAAVSPVCEVDGGAKDCVGDERAPR